MTPEEFNNKLSEINLYDGSPKLDGSHNRCIATDKSEKNSDGFYFYDPTKSFGYAKNHFSGETINIFGSSFKYSIKQKVETQKTLNNNYELGKREANSIYNHLLPLNAYKNKYLKNKNIFNKNNLFLKKGKNDSIVIPIWNTEKEIQSLCFIQKEGQKILLKGGKLSGNFYSIGDIKKAKFVHIAEGLSTALSVRDVVGKNNNEHLFIATMGVNNILNVYTNISEINPNSEKLIYADFHKAIKEKPNEYTFHQKCLKNNLPLYVLPKEDEHDCSDFNDLVLKNGLEKVKEYLKNEFKKKEISNIKVKHNIENKGKGNDNLSM